MQKDKPTVVKRSGKKGMPPGMLIHVGPTYSETAGFICHTYSADSWNRETDHKKIIGNLKPAEDQAIWLQVTGLSDISPLEPLFRKLALNSLISEDILNTSQNSKTEIREKLLFFQLKNISWNASDLSWDSEQISLVLKPDLIVSFAEKESDFLKPIFSRMENPESKLRSHGSDFTFYSITDLVVDSYLETCENLDTYLEDIEIKLDSDSGFDPTAILHQVKKFLVYFRHQVLPIKDGIARLLKETDGLISQDDFPFYQDVLDHVTEVLNQLEQLRENLTSIREFYLTQLSIRMNKVIQLLTMISTIFIPLTFIAGIYGMNFTNMPETNWKYGYYAVLGLMAAVGISFFFYFRKKKWM